MLEELEIIEESYAQHQGEDTSVDNGLDSRRSSYPPEDLSGLEPRWY